MSRPILPWRSPLAHLPSDGAAVWIRRLAFYDQPVRASYSSEIPGFRVTSIAPNPALNLDIDLAPVVVHTWKYQFLADEQAAFPPSP